MKLSGKDSEHPDTVTFYLDKGDGTTESVEVTFNGHIEDVEYAPQESYGPYLFEKTPGDRAKRVAETLEGLKE